MKSIKFLTLTLILAICNLKGNDLITEKINKVIENKTKFFEKQQENFDLALENKDLKIEEKEAIKVTGFIVFMNTQLETCNEIKKILEEHIRPNQSMEELNIFSNKYLHYLNHCSIPELMIKHLDNLKASNIPLRLNKINELKTDDAKTAEPDNSQK